MAAVTKVLVVDDSLTMRALLSGALGRIPDVEVVGAADGAAEARTMVTKFRPDVITLDVEMPEVSGIEYLAELMSTNPLPVIMFSTRTEAGAATSIEALRLGAIDCFPKPKVAAPAEFDAVLEKLGKRIKSAKGMSLKKIEALPALAMPGEWNGKPIALSADGANTQQLFDLIASMPADCPPILIVQHCGPGLVDAMVDKMAGKVSAKVAIAQDMQPIERGHVYFAPQGEHHMVIDAWPGGRTRLLAGAAVKGERPAMALLLASIAKAAGKEAIAALLDGNEDGPAGMKQLAAAGACCLARTGDDFVLTRGADERRVPADKLAAVLLKLASK